MCCHRSRSRPTLWPSACSRRAPAGAPTRSCGQVPAADLRDVRLLASRTTEWARPPVPVLPPKPSIFSRILASKIALGLGLALVFGALTVVMLMITAPKPKKVALTDFTPEPTAAAAATAVTGFATAITGVADRVLEKQGKAKGLNVSIEKAGMVLKAGEFIVISLAIGAVLAAVVFFAYGPVGSLVAFVMGAFVLPRKWLKRKAKKRATAFGEQLSDILQLLSSSLRAGQGLMQAVDSVAREGDAPASEEFRRVVVEARLGRDLIDSLRSMGDRLDSEDFGWVIPAIEINREVGGDLAEVLDTVGTTVRDRADIRRQVKTLSAEGRLSAYVLLALPIAIALMVRASNPEYIGELTKGTGLFVSAAGVLMMTIGGFWLFSLCKIEF
jgi:tight adherence protein B